MGVFVNSSRRTQAFAKMGVRQNGNFVCEKEVVVEEINSNLVGSWLYPRNTAVACSPVSCHRLYNEHLSIVSAPMLTHLASLSAALSCPEICMVRASVVWWLFVFVGLGVPRSAPELIWGHTGLPLALFKPEARLQEAGDIFSGDCWRWAPIEFGEIYKSLVWGFVGATQCSRRFVLTEFWADLSVFEVVLSFIAALVSSTGATAPSDRSVHRTERQAGIVCNYGTSAVGFCTHDPVCFF